MSILAPFLLPAAIAGTAVRTDTEGLMGGGDTVEFTVLDVNERFAALRHVYTENDEEYRPVECRYPGLTAHPTAGVELALMELQSGTVTSFHVYRAAHDGGGEHPQPCTPIEESKRQLAAAKEAFREAELDYERRPKPDINYPIERDPQGSPILSSVIAIGVDIHEDGSETHVWDMPFYWKEHPLETRTTERRGFMGTTTVELADDEQVFYRATRQYDLMQAGHGDVSFAEGYMTPEGMVFVEVFHSFTAMRDSGHTYMYGMTPPIPEWTPWIEIALELVPDRVTEPVPQHVTLLVGEPDHPPKRFDLGKMDGACIPSSSTTPISLHLRCGSGGSGVSIVVRQDEDQLIVERYQSGSPQGSPERIQEIPLPGGAHIRTLLGN